MRYLKIYLILTVLCLILPISSRGLGGSQQEKNSEPAEATLYDYTSRKSFPEIFSAYTVPFVPRARLENSRLLSELIADGKLKLSLEDAIVLALENNLDIAVARYDLPIAQTDLLRAKAGGATRGVAGAINRVPSFPALSAVASAMAGAMEAAEGGPSWGAAFRPLAQWVAATPPSACFTDGTTL